MVKILFRRSSLGLVIALLLVSVLTLTLFFPYSASAASFTFKNFELSAITGTVCPNTHNTCTNGAAEPAIRADNAGNFYASSENGLGAGTDAFKSTNGGKNYTTLPSPNSASQSNNTGFAPGGGDTDLATAPVKNANGLFNV